MDPGATKIRSTEPPHSVPKVRGSWSARYSTTVSLHSTVRSILGSRAGGDSSVSAAPSTSGHRGWTKPYLGEGPQWQLQVSVCPSVHLLVQLNHHKYTHYWHKPHIPSTSFNYKKIITISINNNGSLPCSQKPGTWPIPSHINPVPYSLRLI